MSGAMDRSAMREESQKIYAALGVDGRVVMACRRREGQSQAGTQANGAPMQRVDAAATASGQTPSGTPGTQLQLENAERSSSGPRVRPALVFVAKGKTFEARSVMLGAGNFDYTEVVSGLQEGEEVALLASLALQAQRQQQNDRLREGMGGVPGMNQSNPRAGQGGGARPAGGGR
jgi:HlyD family secretion protein